VRHQTVGSLVRLLEHSGPLRTALRTIFPAPGDRDFLLETLPARLREIGELRNRAAHDSGVTIEELLPVRNGVVGVGCESLLVRVAELRDRRR
jgi:hypothetical protein